MPAQVQGAELSHPLPGTAGLEALIWGHHPRVIYCQLSVPPKRKDLAHISQPPACHILEERQEGDFFSKVCHEHSIENISPCSFYSEYPVLTHQGTYHSSTGHVY